MANKTAEKICFGAIFAALYAALTLAVPAISYGPLQIRIGEALAVLPVFYPFAAVGLTLGCFLSNLIGLLSGANPLGLIDLFIGTAATFISALATAYLGKKFKDTRLIYILAPLPPIVFNAVFVGLELTFFMASFSPAAFAVYAMQVAAGEIISCGLGGGAVLKGLKSYFNKNRKG